MAWSMWARPLMVAAALVCLAPAGPDWRTGLVPGVIIQGVDFLTRSAGFAIVAPVTHPPAPLPHSTSDGQQHRLARPLWIQPQTKDASGMVLPTAIRPPKAPEARGASSGRLLIPTSPVIGPSHLLQDWKRMHADYPTPWRQRLRPMSPTDRWPSSTSSWQAVWPSCWDPP